jgi:DNA-binding transcriptional ArsR family regulator/rhodanese-related sulfurtransferase
LFEFMMTGGIVAETGCRPRPAPDEEEPMADRAPKEALFDRLAEVAKALGNGRRAELIDVLAQGERSVEVLAGEIGQSTANTSHHLKVLARAGLVTTRREGNHIYYRLTSERVAELWSALRDVASRHVAGISEYVDAYLGPRDNIATMTRDELVSNLDTGGVVVLDVRPLAEYEAGHIPSAVPIDPLRLYDQLRQVPRDATVVAYCRGPFCAYACEAVRALETDGITALRLEEGFPEWRRAGLPVESGRADVVHA